MTLKQVKYLIEVYIDDFIAAAQATSTEELKHIARALLHAIHDVFPEGVFTDDDQPVSVKKIKKGEAQWSVLKEVLGWLFDGKNKSTLGHLLVNYLQINIFLEIQ